MGAFLNFLGNSGSSIISSAMGLIAGAVQGRKNRNFQAEEAEKQRQFAQQMAAQQNQYEIDRMALQADYNKQAADYSQQLSKDMWDYTNYENQVKHMKNANLNPALMYGSAGGGGSTSGGNMQGVSAITPMGLQVGLQAQQTQAQTDLIRAQTEKVQSDTNLQNMTQFAKSIAETISIINGSQLTNTNKKKVTYEIQSIQKTIEQISEQTNLIKENVALAKFNNFVNNLLKNSQHTENGKTNTFDEAVISKFYQEFKSDMSRLEKEYFENNLNKDVAKRLMNDIDLIVKGRLDEISISTKKLEELGILIDKEKWELDSSKAAGDILEKFGGEGKYARLLLHFLEMWLRK